MITITEGLRNYLVENDIVRLPNVPPGIDNLPVCYIDLIEGCPDPNDLTGTSSCDVVVHLSEVSGLSANQFENYEDSTSIRLIIRTKPNLKSFNQAWKLGKQISSKLRWQVEFDLGGLHINTVRLYNAFNRMPPLFEENGYTFTMELLFHLRLSEYDI